MSAWTLRAANRDDAPALVRLSPLLDARPPLLDDPEGGELLVAEPANGSVRDGLLGCVRLRYGIGLALPRYWFHVGCAVHAAAELGLFHRQRTLLLGNDLTGAVEICDLALAPSADSAAPAARDALANLLGAAVDRIAARPEAPPRCEPDGTRVIVEVPGQRDAAGNAPFWQGFGRHFYGGDPRHAAERHGRAWRSHVASLLPRDPLLVSFLEPRAQAAIGVPGPTSWPLLEVLRAAGFRGAGHVTLEDGGPVLEAGLDDLRRALRA